MDTPKNTLLNWPYYCQGKSIEELHHSLVCSNLDLQTTRLAAQEEIRKREEQLTHLQELLNKAITERDEALENYNALLLDKPLSQQQQQQQMIAPQVVHSGSSSSIEDEPSTTRKGLHSNSNNNYGGNLSASDSEESIISSPSSLPSSALPENALQLLSPKKPLPEKGKLLLAVTKAGPLLQTLLLAGPLPQWRHPPPPLETLDIPPVTISGAAAPPPAVHLEEVSASGSNICGNVSRKRGFANSIFDGSYSEASKYQRVLLH